MGCPGAQLSKVLSLIITNKNNNKIGGTFYYHLNRKIKISSGVQEENNQLLLHIGFGLADFPLIKSPIHQSRAQC